MCKGGGGGGGGGGLRGAMKTDLCDRIHQKVPSGEITGSLRAVRLSRWTTESRTSEWV